MRMVGTVALDPGDAPGAGALTLACDLGAAVVQVTGRLRRGAAAVVRIGAALRTHGPVVAALVTSLRARPTTWTAAMAGPGANVPRLHGAAEPRRGSAPRTRPAKDGHRELVLPSGPTAPGVARAFLQCVAEEWGVGGLLVQDAALVITELVANAVDHARTESTLSLGVTRDGLRVAVRDTRPGPVPRPAPIDPTAARGRGLQIVDALTTAWGVTQHAGGKTVWAVLGPVRE